MYYIVTIQEVKQQYEKWSADRTTLEILFDDDPSPVIELDQQEQEVDQWKILPLSSLSRVSNVFCYRVESNNYFLRRSPKLLSRTTKLVEESLTVDLS